MIVLVLNCGSSSLKYQVLDMKSDNEFNLLAKGLVERIGEKMGSLTHRVPGQDKYEVEKPIPDHTVGIKEVLNLLVSKEHGVLESLSQIEAVGHRVAHGGEYFKGSAFVDDKAYEEIGKLCALAPLHNPANMLGIDAVKELMPGTPNVAVFDTAFHQTMPDYAFTYAIPYEYYEKYAVRRYGFHGTSHKFVSARGAEFAGIDLNNSKIITCHLGNGSSITAVRNGESIDTSMGFTPLEGLPMGTRSGSMDPTIIPFLGIREKLDPAQMEKMLNKRCGLLGVSGVSSDCRDIEEAAKQGNPRASLALNLLCYNIKKYIGAYSAALGGVDLIVFTGGIGENSSSTRRDVCDGLEYLGVKLDDAVNDATHGKDTIISTPDSRVKVCVIATNEELMIARDTMNIVKNLKK
ncbi:MAG: acetate kinase [Bacteroidales bacterium]|nr:acetate kinase [Bacteroidales bacterium]